MAVTGEVNEQEPRRNPMLDQEVKRGNAIRVLIIPFQPVTLWRHP